KILRMCNVILKKSSKAMSILLVSGFTLSSISSPLVTYANTPVEQKQSDVQYTVENLPVFPTEFDKELLFEALSHDLIIFEEGMEHPVIEQLKLSLQELGFGTEWKTLTPEYDDEMQDVVKELQKYYVLSVNGKIDEETQETLKELLMESPQMDIEYENILPLKEKLYTVMNREISTDLTNVFDADMKALVEEFQKSHELVVNGIVDPVTYEKLDEIYEELKATEDESSEKEIDEENPTEESQEEVVEKEEIEKSQEQAATENDEKEAAEEIVEGEVVVEVQEEEATDVEEVEKSQAATSADTHIETRMAAAPMAKNVTYYAKGMRSAEVKKMKQNLMKIGFGTHWKNPTTLFGADTEKVVKEFQRYYGLSVDGSMGPA